MIAMPLAGYILAGLVQSAAPLAHSLDTSRDTGRYLNAGQAMIHALAARAAQTHDAPAELMLALAARESHFVPTSGPHGHWPLRAKDYPHRRHYIAGPCQTTEPTIARAVAVRNPFEGYRSCAEQLGQWAAACRRWNVANVRVCQLAGFARGVRDARSGARTYADDVINRAGRLMRSSRPVVQEGAAS